MQNIVLNPYPVQPSVGQLAVSEDEKVDMSEAFREAFRKHLGHEEKGTVIVRMDELPSITGSRQKVMKLIDILLSAILNHPPLNSKLFLYVKCEEFETIPGESNFRLVNGCKLFKLFIHTNISTDDFWLQVHGSRLKEAMVIAEDLNGAFQFNNISNTGCLFSLTIPGKHN